MAGVRQEPAGYPPPVADILQLAVLTLATSGLNGEPHAAPVYFAADGDLHLYFFSDENSQHAQDTGRDPRASAAVYPEQSNWQDIHGLQIRGVVQRVEAGEQWEQAWELYLAKFPFVAALKELVARNTLYVLVPHWVRLVDNRQGFGYKEEWTIA